MVRRKKAPEEQLVNVGLKVPVDIKQALANEAKSVDIPEGTLARRYLISGMKQAHHTMRTGLDITTQNIVNVLKKMSAEDRTDILAIVHALYDRRAGLSKSEDFPPWYGDPAEQRDSLREPTIRYSDLIDVDPVTHLPLPRKK